MNDKKKIYSLNLMAYILMVTGIEPVIYLDNENLSYARFPICKQVAMAILKYRDSSVIVNLHNYLEAYNIVRELIKKRRNEYVKDIDYIS